MNATGLRYKEVLLTVFLGLFLITVLPPNGYGAQKTFRNSLGMEFIQIPVRTFVMGSPANEPHRGKDESQHRVTLTNPFYLQLTEVTLKQWWAVMGKKFFGRRKGPENMPVVKISWYNAQRFIKKMNKKGEGYYRLPTEAEWEYAARAGSTTAYSWGDTIDCNNAMYGNNRKKANECQNHIRARGLEPDRPAPVKSYPPNARGLYDMHGNVWEWCRDWYGRYGEQEITDPRGPQSGPGKVRRGGSWFKHGHACRSANRTYANPASKFQTTGFRLIWSRTPDGMMEEETEVPALDKEPDAP